MLQDIYHHGNTNRQVAIRSKLANKIGNYRASDAIKHRLLLSLDIDGNILSVDMWKEVLTIYQLWWFITSDQ